MSALFILLMAKPHRPELLEDYRRLGRAAFEGSGGSFVVLPGGKLESVEGPTAASVVVVSFESFAQAQAWYHSDAYQAALQFRHPAVDSHAVIVESA